MALKLSHSAEGTYHAQSCRYEDQEGADADGCAALLALHSAVFTLPPTIGMPRLRQRSPAPAYATIDLKRGRSGTPGMPVLAKKGLVEQPGLVSAAQTAAESPQPAALRPQDHQAPGQRCPSQPYSPHSQDCEEETLRKKQRSAISTDLSGVGSDTSGGSAKDILYPGQQELCPVSQHHEEDETLESLTDMEDMEVVVVSDTEKGCQVWFPPLPGDYGRRRTLREQQASGKGLINVSRSADPKKQVLSPRHGSSSGAEEAICGSGPLMARFGSNEMTQLNPSLMKKEVDRRYEAAYGPGDGTSLLHEGSGSKRRLIWSEELHDRFLAAIKKLGVRNAVPKAIMTEMDMEGMTRENVASHLQKYRMHLKMLGTAANLSADEMMALHVNGEAGQAAGERKWNEGDNRPRFPVSGTEAGVQGKAASAADTASFHNAPQGNRPGGKLWTLSLGNDAALAGSASPVAASFSPNAKLGLLLGGGLPSADMLTTALQGWNSGHGMATLSHQLEAASSAEACNLCESQSAGEAQQPSQPKHVEIFSASAVQLLCGSGSSGKGEVSGAAGGGLWNGLDTSFLMWQQ